MSSSERVILFFFSTGRASDFVAVVDVVVVVVVVVLAAVIVVVVVVVVLVVFVGPFAEAGPEFAQEAGALFGDPTLGETGRRLGGGRVGGGGRGGRRTADAVRMGLRRRRRRRRRRRWMELEQTVLETGIDAAPIEVGLGRMRVVLTAERVGGYDRVLAPVLVRFLAAVISDAGVGAFVVNRKQKANKNKPKNKNDQDGRRRVFPDAT